MISLIQSIRQDDNLLMTSMQHHLDSGVLKRTDKDNKITAFSRYKNKAWGFSLIINTKYPRLRNWAERGKSIIRI